MSEKKKKPSAPPGEVARSESAPQFRVFKAPKFAQEAHKRGITDKELCDAIKQVQASPKSYSLGGAVYKKRLNNNKDRAIVLAKGGNNWFYAHIFKKSAQANLSVQELEQFKAAAKVLGALTTTELDFAVKMGKLQEICHDGPDPKGK